MEGETQFRMSAGREFQGRIGYVVTHAPITPGYSNMSVCTLMCPQFDFKSCLLMVGE